MRTVVVVGAGGSLGQAQALRASRTRDHPPLDATFFDKVTELAKKKASLRVSATSLRAAIRRSSFATDPWAFSSLSMEQFFADVYYEVASGRDPQALHVYRLLVDLYSRVLRETTDWIALNSRIGTLGRLLRHEIRRSDPDKVTVITFNQDLILENLTVRLPRSSDGWCLSSLYCAPDLKPLSYSSLPPDERFAHHRTGCRDDPPVHLLKLHGSLNWSIRTTSRDPAIGTLFPEGRGRAREIWVTDRRSVQQPARKMTTGATRGRSSWYLWPLIVPPIYDKQRITGLEILAGIWQTARERIEAAERLLLVGYSLPDGDILARQLLRSGVSRNNELECVDCINPDSGMAPKLHDVLSAKVVRIYDDMASYLRHG